MGRIDDILLKPSYAQLLHECSYNGISMFLLVMRAQLSGIISTNVARKFYINASKASWRKNEAVRMLLKIPYDEIVSHCCFSEDR
jgi:hypothetical protein